MTLANARYPDGRSLDLPGPFPMLASELAALAGIAVMLEPGDDFVRGTGTAAHAYLDGARAAWRSEPDYMEFLDEDSPVWGLKTAERDLYLHHWKPWWDGAERVLDLGCGIGRFALPLLERGATVYGVDADLRSLQSLLWRAAGGSGRLDLSWSSAHALPDVMVDLAIASEVLCYVPEIDSAMAALAARIRCGGTLLLSMEARWGWATAMDASPGAFWDAVDGDGVVDMAEEGWVRTYTEADLRALLERHGFDVELCVPTHYVTDGPLERVAPAEAGLEELLSMDEACRKHPVWSPLNRIWTAVGRKR